MDFIGTARLWAAAFWFRIVAIDSKITAVLYFKLRFGGVPKWLKGVVLKTTRRVILVRGFKSHPLRHNNFVERRKEVETMQMVFDFFS